MDRPQLLMKVVEWLRAGYPTGVPQGDYIPLVALLRRQLFDDELDQVTSDLIDDSLRHLEPISKIDAGVKITKVTDELPTPSTSPGCGSCSSWPAGRSTTNRSPTPSPRTRHPNPSRTARVPASPETATEPAAPAGAGRRTGSPGPRTRSPGSSSTAPPSRPAGARRRRGRGPVVRRPRRRRTDRRRRDIGDLDIRFDRHPERRSAHRGDPARLGPSHRGFSRRTGQLAAHSATASHRRAAGAAAGNRCRVPSRVIDVRDGFGVDDFVRSTGELDGVRRYTSLVPTQLIKVLASPAATDAARTFDAILVGGAATRNCCGAKRSMRVWRSCARTG